MNCLGLINDVIFSSLSDSLHGSLEPFIAALPTVLPYSSIPSAGR